MAPRRWFLALSLLLSFLLVPSAAAHAASSTTGFKFVDVPGDGVTLKANYIAPTGSGTHPAVIFPASWGLNDLEYLAQAQKLAEGGYVVVSYTPRGWWLSGGEIDTAGPKDMADLSKLIDWTIANTPADPNRIGAAGISYGAGISLLGSAFDPRIKVVAAMSGWTDLVYSLYGNQTRHEQSAGFLQLAAQLLGHPGTDLTTKLGDFNANRNIPDVMSWAQQRSAGTFLDKINANHPAVMIANAWGDSFFPPNQLISFFGGLTGPKRLELRPGDHAIAELTGVIGLPNDVWTSVRRWLDHYLSGIDNGVASEPSLQVKPANAAIEGYASWTALATSTKRYDLGSIRLLDGTGLLGTTSSASWRKTLPSGYDTTANGGIALITNGAAAITGIPPQVWLPTVDRTRAGVWASNRPSSALRIRGVPHVHLNLTGTASHGTVVAYLYDLDALGTATLITHAPATWLDGSGNRTVDLDLSAAGYDVAAGHSLTLVVDTVDPLYYDADTRGDTVTVTQGSYLDVPTK